MSGNQNAKVIFLSAIEITQQAERDAFVANACGEDEALFREVSALLAVHFEKDTWLDAGLMEPSVNSPSTDSPESPGAISGLTVGSQIGHYKLLEQIGTGGMGVVFMAEQQKPIRRKVALKIIKPGMDTKQVIARFEAERQALALMDHPNIAHVLDAGSTDSGHPYFVMELVRGIPITEYCDKNRLSTGERLKLFTSVCQAVQHAHNKGIIHRDIKPANVLVTLHDGVPVPKVIDFGVAKATNQQLTERTLFTSFAQFVGTPLYMSPEQAEMSGLDIDTRSDIYSLGVLLYELLTGTTPFDRMRIHKAALDEIRRIIREEEPPRPSTRVSSMGDANVPLSMQRSTDPLKLKQLLQRELDWIVMKTLEKDRTRRYETVSQLATEIQRYLNGQAVEACPPSSVYRLNKFASRHRTAVLVAASFFLLIVSSMVVSWGLYARASHARDLALVAQAESQRERDHALVAERSAAKHLTTATLEKERADSHARELKQRLYDYNIIKAHAACRDKDLTTTSSLLSECLPEQRGWEWSYLNRQTRAPRSIKLPGNTNWEFAITSDMMRIILIDSEGVIRCARFSDGSVIWSRQSEIQIPTGSVISQNDEQIVVTGGRKTGSQGESGQPFEEGTIQAFNLANGDLLWTQRPTCAMTFLPSYCQDGTQFLVTAAISSTESEIQLRASSDGNLLWSTPAFTVAHAIMNKTGTRVFISETKQQQIQAPSALRCLNAADRTQIWQVTRSDEASSILLSPDGTDLLATGNDLSLILYDPETGNLRQRYPSSLKEPGLFVLGSSAGNHLATVSRSGHFVVWDWQSRRVIEESKAITLAPFIRLTSDGSQMAFLDSESNLLHVRPSRSESDSLTLVGHPSGFKGARFIDQNHLCSVGNEGALRHWRMPTGQEESATPIGAAGSELEVSNDGAWIAAATTKGTKMWERATGRLLQDWPQDGQCWFVKRNASGSLLATAGQQGVLRLYRASEGTSDNAWSIKVETPTREMKASTSIHGLAVSHDGNTIYTLDSPGCEVIVWDAMSGNRQIMRNSQAGQTGRTAELSPDERFLAIGVDQTVEIWDITSRKVVSVLRGGSGKVLSLTYDRTGSRLFAGTGDGTISLWNLTSQERLLSFKAHPSYVVCLAMSPDNSTLASSSFGGELKLWETQILNSEDATQRSLVQHATAQANRLLVEYRTAPAALQHLVTSNSLSAELMPIVTSILQARMNAPLNLNALSQVTETADAAKQSRRDSSTVSAYALKQKIDAAIGNNLSVLLNPTIEAPDELVAANWNALCRSLVQKSRFNLEPSELIELLQQIKDNGDAPHYILYLKAIAHLQVSEWQIAENEMSQALVLVPPRSPLWFTYAFRLSFLHAHVGNWEAHQKLCNESVENFKESNSSMVLERIAKMCLFSKRAGIDLQTTAAMADRANAQEEFGATRVFRSLTQGIADLRRKNYDAALERFDFVVRSGGPGSKDGNDITLALAKLYIAIASHHLGRTEAARQQLSEASTIIQSFPPGTGWWPDWMMGSIVLKEAEELIVPGDESSPNEPIP